MPKELRIIGFVMAFFFVMICYLLNENISVIKESNRLSAAEAQYRHHEEYERVLIGCTAFTKPQTNTWMQELCSERLVTLRNALAEKSPE